MHIVLYQAYHASGEVSTGRSRFPFQPLSVLIFLGVPVIRKHVPVWRPAFQGEDGIATLPPAGIYDGVACRSGDRRTRARMGSPRFPQKAVGCESPAIQDAPWRSEGIAQGCVTYVTMQRVR